MMKTYDMSRTYEASLTILKEIGRICRKYNIRYMLDAGTPIGVVRRKGFIPWDDDADVTSARNQHEALMKMVPRELPDTTELLEPDSYKDGKAFYDFAPRIIYKKSKHHEDSPEIQHYEGELSHIWVDLFILDKSLAFGTGEEFARFLHKTVYGMTIGYKYKLDFDKYSLVHKIFVGGLVAAGRLVPMKLTFAIQKAAAPKDRYSKGSLRYYSNYQSDYLYATVSKPCCDQVKDSDFEDTCLMIPKGWHQILTEVYGNYMEVPSKDKRVPAHSSQRIRVFDQSVPERRSDTHWGDEDRETGSIYKHAPGKDYRQRRWTGCYQL